MVKEDIFLLSTEVDDSVSKPNKDLLLRPISNPTLFSLASTLYPKTLKAITETPYQHVHMSPVQEKVLGMLDELVEGKEGKGLLVRVKTGTGKMLAFLVSGIERR